MEEAPEYIICPLSMEVYIDPVVTPNGSIYERRFIMEWLENHDTDPMDSNFKLKARDLESEKDVARAARLWRQNKNKNSNNNDDGIGIGLKWSNGHKTNEQQMNDDDEWSDNDNDNDQDINMNMNEFKNGLTNDET